ncbi:uncharacterized protein LOC124159363 isoform X2 [Ischnura elegans]|uniref:uncharacterized protein LOC124159363 isoform X2 n=1 Tax=Ischnura elegans TaxID=197161 RepID=UPI001ED89ED4|nr:uncharacterized protein LOC124159363 isoform X2 [Ischnura elegans]
MSRHRNVRSTNFYSEECEGFDDVYGHSVEDDYCVSPSVAEQFLYDRNRRQQMSVFLGQEEEIAEEDEGEEGDEEAQPGMGDAPKSAILSSTQGLSDIDQARLQSCLEEVRNVVGDSIAEQTVIEAVLRCEFNVEKALNMVLNNATGVSETGASKIQKTDLRKEKDVCSNCSSYFSQCFSNKDSPSILNSEDDTVAQQGRIGGCVVCHKDSFIDSPVLEVAIGSGESSGPEIPSGRYLDQSSTLIGQQKEEAAGDRDGLSTVFPTSRHLPELAPINLSAPSDSEDEEDESFPSLKSLVIHNTSAQGATSSTFESKREGGGSTKDKMPIGFDWSPHVGTNLQIGAVDDSEDSEDEFSSLCSLVVHNRNDKGPLLPKPHEPVVKPPLCPPQITNIEQMTMAPPKLRSQSNSSSEEDDFSSLQSLVVRNRSAPIENEVSGLHGNWAQSPPKAIISNSSVKDNLTKKVLMMKDSDSEDDDNYSSLCSLVIHNRNTQSSGQDTSGTVSAPSLGQKTDFVSLSGSKSSGMVDILPEHKGELQGSSFVIPPLLVSSKPQLGLLAGSHVTESEESEEGDDYVIDLCGTLKSLDVESVASVEEEAEQQDDQTQSNFASEGGECKKDIEWSIKEEGWACELPGGIKLLDLNSRNLSSFGRVLCKNWECLKQIECPGKRDVIIGSDIVAFLFDKESPDDICKRLRSQKYLIQVKTANNST